MEDFLFNGVFFPPTGRSYRLTPVLFDGLVASSVFEYLPDVDAVLLECQRVLKPRGILIATVPSPLL